MANGFIGIEFTSTYLDAEAGWPNLVIDVPAGTQDDDTLILGIFQYFSSLVVLPSITDWGSPLITPTSEPTGTRFGYYTRTAASEPSSYDLGNFNNCIGYIATYRGETAGTTDIDLYDGSTSSPGDVVLTIAEDAGHAPDNERIHYTFVNYAAGSTGTHNLVVTNPADGPTVRGTYEQDRTATTPDVIDFGQVRVYDELLTNSVEPSRTMSLNFAQPGGLSMRAQYNRLTYLEEAPTPSSILLGAGPKNKLRMKVTHLPYDVARPQLRP